MKISEMFPSRWLSAEDLRNKKGERVEVPVIIAAVKPESLYNSRTREHEEKYVLYFEGKKKGLVLNVTNARTIAGVLASEDTADWIGREIVLVPTETKAFGEVVDCIRVRALLAEGQKNQPRIEHG